ncbi:MAG: hypothetical protein LBO63_07700 [Oscillospiraceae bacterium]|jgi:DUF1365 family protein|nr:hypothetical protein [Oscillospiraceae bacterium]
MKRTEKIIAGTYFVFWMSVLFSQTALAYVDPATTGMIVQIVAGIFISLGVVIGIFRQKVVLFFKGLSVRATQKKIERQKKDQDKKDL